MVSEVRPGSAAAAAAASLIAARALGLRGNREVLITLLNTAGLLLTPLQITHIKIENKHNRRTYTLLRCPPHLLPCPATRFTAVPVASATCSLWIFFFFFVPLFIIFPFFRPRTRQCHNSGLPGYLVIQPFPEEKIKGWFSFFLFSFFFPFKPWGFYTYKGTDAVPLHPRLQLGGVISERQSRAH